MNYGGRPLSAVNLLEFIIHYKKATSASWARWYTVHHILGGHSSGGFWSWILSYFSPSPYVNLNVCSKSTFFILPISFQAVTDAEHKFYMYM